MMRKLYQVLLLVVVCTAGCFPQSTTDVSGQSSASPNSINCSDPFQASNPQCIAGAQMGGAVGSQTRTSPSLDMIPQLRAPLSGYETPTPPRTPNPSRHSTPS